MYPSFYSPISGAEEMDNLSLPSSVITSNTAQCRRVKYRCLYLRGNNIPGPTDCLGKQNYHHNRNFHSDASEDMLKGYFHRAI